LRRSQREHLPGRARNGDNLHHVADRGDGAGPRDDARLRFPEIFRVGPLGLAVIIGLTSWTGGARLVRGQTLQIREAEFIGAARSIGATNLRILWQHLLPNVLPIAIVLLGIDVGEAILRESALSYLGLGIQPPDASWGNMLSSAQSFFTRAPWLVYAPGAVIATTVWCLFTLGDGLRDALDPRHMR
jgi:peptide/nickel transport system permease protein